MSKIFNVLDKYLVGPMGKLSTFQFVRAIMAAGMASIPFTIVGSMFLVVSVIPQAFPALQSIWNASFVKFTDLYMIANHFTMGVLAVYFCLVMGYSLTKIKAEDQGLNLDPLNGALLSLMAFFFTIPELTVKGGTMTLIQRITSTEHVYNGIRLGDFATRLGTAGIFTGILMACLATWLYALCVKKHWTIRMPDAVPAGVSKSFTALIPAFVIAIAVLVINAVLVLLGFDIYKIIQVPFSFITNVTNSWYGMIIIYFLIGVLWSAGIHGANIIHSFTTPIVLANLAHNVTVVQSGTGHIMAYAGEFENSFVSIGGSGATLGLVIFMIFLSKSDQLRVLGKAAIAPAIFNINEPIIFGAPIIYNPYLVIPFILGPIVSSLIAFFTISAGIVSPLIVQAPWPTPLGICAFLSTGGDIKASILAVVCIGVASAIYYPFFKFYDRKLAREEQVKEKELEAEKG